MVGIICEYNPFHNGHLYHLNKVKELFPNEVITLVLVGNFLNRGDVSVINKWDKTKLALDYGIDLVVELPFAFATQSADIYAYGAISILDNLKCDYLVFGSELNDIDILYKIADTNIDIKDLLKKGYNYPKAIDIALKNKINISINTPNDLLGVSYIKAIKKLNSKIKPITIKRTNDYHNKNTNGKISSATSIRNLIFDNIDISEYVPNTNYIKNINLNDFYLIIKHKIMTEDLTKYQDIDVSLNSLLKKNILKSNNIEELISNVKHKNYTYNRIKRCLVHILCCLDKKDYKLEHIRILGFNSKGRQYLNKIKKEVTLPLLTKYDNYELLVDNIYNLISKDINKNKPILKK